MESRMKRKLNHNLIRDHINITTIHRKHRATYYVIKMLCFAGVLLTLGYLMGCVYLDWAGLYD